MAARGEVRCHRGLVMRGTCGLLVILTLAGGARSQENAELDRALAMIERVNGVVHTVAIEGGKRAFEVGFAGNRDLSDDDLALLKHLPQLEVLVLSDTPITDRGLEHLKDLSQLRALRLDGTRISDAGLKHLAGLK